MISVRNLQREVPLNVKWLRRFSTAALAEVQREVRAPASALATVEEVAVAIVSDQQIARAHVDFTGIEGATDVLTFDTGDIMISAETARAYAVEFQQTVDHEVARYVMHGLLHLAGYDDQTPHDRRRMHAVQERLLQACVARLSSG